MELKLNSGRLSVPIIRDGKKAGVLCFNPSDINFVDNFRATAERYDQYINELRTRSAALEDGDDDGYLALIREICARMCTAIDELFGPGTSDAAFGCTPCSPEPFEDFFGGVTDLIREYRMERMKRYLPTGAETEDGLV